MAVSAIKIPHFVLDENSGKYQARKRLTAQQIVNTAKKLLAKQVHKDVVITGSRDVIDYLIVNYAERKNEAFCCLYLDNQNGLIEFDEVFTGTYNAASVYARVIAQRCLEINAASVIFAHNHPSGGITPSFADHQVTQDLKDTLRLVDVNIIDHVVIGGGCSYSFADSGVL